MGRLGTLVQDVRMILQSVANPSSKFITYFQLLDAFKKEGCPVCILLEEGAVKALDGLMYEQVNDPFTRDRLLESHGFCNWHAWMLPRRRSITSRLSSARCVRGGAGNVSGSD
jgi:hypothetical protein